MTNVLVKSRERSEHRKENRIGHKHIRREENGVYFVERNVKIGPGDVEAEQKSAAAAAAAEAVRPIQTRPVYRVEERVETFDGRATGASATIDAMPATANG